MNIAFQRVVGDKILTRNEFRREWRGKYRD